MHIVLTLLGILGGFGYYWFVIRNASNAVGEIADVAGRARGAYRRNQFRKKADAATINAIDDPRTAAVVMAVAVASSEGDMTAEQDDVLKDMMTGMLGIKDPVEDLTFAKWAVREVNDPNNISMRLHRLWTSSLDMQERQQLVDMVADVAAAGGELSNVQREAIERLRTRLAITV
ncbi:MAG TPA: hypothetical protein VKN63_01010 [Afifellaceae bacterium]|nr:hypothetical protein [Afifellaceae bacterium]